MELNAFALTGPIGSAKSTVATLLAHYCDIHTINTDDIAKQIMSEVQNQRIISQILGKEVFWDGILQTKLVAEIIFNDIGKKTKLELFIHPKVWQRIKEIVAFYSKDHICIVEMAMLYETNSQSKFELGVISTVCDKVERVRRLELYRNMSLTDIESRMSSQKDRPDLESETTLVINTECELKEMPKRVQELYNQIKKIVSKTALIND